MDPLGTKAIGQSVENAAKTIHDTANDITTALAEKDIPAATAMLSQFVANIAMTLAGVIADATHRLHGAECPVNVKIKAEVEITGGIGPVKLTMPPEEAGVQPSVTVEG